MFQLHMTRVVHLGACDWRHPEWLGPFYPEDMPEEWQLAFYYTQFSCVWIDGEAWYSAGAAERQAWRAEVGASFRFLVGAKAQADGRLGNQFPFEAESLDDGPLVIPDSDAVIIWFDKHSDLSDLTQRIKAAVGAEPIHVICRDADLDKLSQVTTLLELLGMQ